MFPNLHGRHLSKEADVHVVHMQEQIQGCVIHSDLHIYLELLALRTEKEWEEVKQRISELPQDEALSAELSKVQCFFFLFLCQHSVKSLLVLGSACHITALL